MAKSDKRKGEVAKADLSKLAPRRLVDFAGHKKDAWRVAFDPWAPAPEVFSVGDDARLVSWNAANGHQIADVTIKDHAIHALDIDRTGRYVAVASVTPFKGEFSGVLRIWDRQVGQVIEIFGIQAWMYHSAAVAAHGRWAAAGGESRALLVWNLQDPTMAPDARGDLKPSYRELVTPRALSDSILAVDIHANPAKPFVVAGCKDGSLKMFRILPDRLVEIGARDRGHIGEVRCVQFHPSRDEMSSAGKDGDWSTWDIDRLQIIRTKKTESGVNWLSYSPDGLLIASAHDDGTVRLWDVKTGEIRAKIDAHKGGALGVAFDPTGQLLATCGRDFLVSTWRLFPKEDGGRRR